MNPTQAKYAVIEAIRNGDLHYADVKQIMDVLFTKLWLDASKSKAELEEFYTESVSTHKGEQP